MLYAPLYGEVNAMWLDRIADPESRDRLPRSVGAYRFITRADLIARWDGVNWSPLGAGIAGSAYASVKAPIVLNSDGPALFVGGAFSSAGSNRASNFARWGCPLLRGDVDCSGAINFLDIDPFLLALTDPAGYAATYPDCSISRADEGTENQTVSLASTT